MGVNDSVSFFKIRLLPLESEMNMITNIVIFYHVKFLHGYLEDTL
jgi:hypothetical protein